MNRWCIAAILIAALLLVGAAGAVKPEKEPVDKVVFIHFKDGSVRTAPGGDASTMFKLMGPKWTTFPVQYHLNTANSWGLTDAELRREFAGAFGEWDDHSGPVWFSSLGSKPPVQGDRQNDVSFAALGDPKIIAVTSVWFYRSTKAIVEADIQMNDALPWEIYAYGTGADVPGATAFDVRNIATHEIGHVCGLGDLYRGTGVSVLTMYGYGREGEVRKDTLEPGDIAGLQKLYGA
jgi:hypothetical protein